jgi:peptidyl-prolyl cis-trans isomerase C
MARFVFFKLKESIAMMIKSKVVLLSAAAVLVLGACTQKDAAKSAAAPAKDGVAATVNGVAISSSRVDMMVKQRTAQGQPDSPELRKAIIENLAMQMLVAEEAVKKGLDKTPETANQMELVKQSILANAYVQDFITNTPVAEDILKAEYEKVKAERSGNEYKARHILVAKEQDAKDIIAKLKKDAKAFEGLAKEKSMDPGSKGNGGDLGWFDARMMVPEFGAALAKMTKGKFSDEPVKSQFGYHVILLEDTRPITPPPFDQIKDQLKQKIQQQNLSKFLDETKAKAKIEITGAPAAPAASAPLAAPAAASAAPAAASAAPAAASAAASK